MLKVLKTNPRLSYLHRTAESQLEAVDGDIPPHLFPTEAELEHVLSPYQEITTLGMPPVREAEDYQSQEITNTVIRVLSTENPSETTKKIKRFERIKQFFFSRSK